MNTRCNSWRWAGAFLLGVSVHVRADVAVIVNPDSPVEALSRAEIADLYLAKTSRTASGVRLLPIDQSEGEMPRQVFYDQVVGKSASQLNSYWSRLIFTGKARPPIAVANDAEVIELVAMNPSMVGYVSQSAAGDRVRVVLVVDEPGEEAAK